MADISLRSLSSRGSDLSLRSLSSRGSDLSPRSDGSDRADLSLSSGMPGRPGRPDSSLFPNMARRARVPHRSRRSGRTSSPAHPDRPARTRPTGLPARTRLTGFAARPGRTRREQRDLLLTGGARRTGPHQVQRVKTLGHTRVQRSTRLRRRALCIPALVGDRRIGHPSRHGQSDDRDQRGAPRPPSDEAFHSNSLLWLCTRAWRRGSLDTRLAQSPPIYIAAP
jgi:hypothetical protein